MDAMTSENSWRYRGWRVVAVSAAAMVATLPGRTVGLGLITEPLLADLDITRTNYANLTFWATIVGATFSLVCGPAIDRWGVKRVLAGTLMLVAFTTSATGRFVSASSLLLCLTLARGFGQSSLSTASVTTVGKWFSDKLGIALGCFSAMVALGFAISIPVLGGAITAGNWRDKWMQLGLGIGLLGLTVLAVVPRQLSDVKANAQETVVQSSRTLSYALRSQVFWVFTASTALYYLVLSGLTLFNEAIIAELGYGRDTFIKAMAAMMGAGLIGNFLYGWLSERVSITRMLAANLLLLGLVLVSFPWLTTQVRIILHAALYGIVGGAFAVLFFTGYSKAFGQNHLGKIQGAAQVFGVVASALGPKLLAETEATTASFLPAFRWLAPIAFLLAIVAWRTRIPVSDE